MSLTRDKRSERRRTALLPVVAVLRERRRVRAWVGRSPPGPIVSFAASKCAVSRS